MSPRRLTLDALLDVFRPGAGIYLPGATAELAFLYEAFEREPERLAGVSLVSCLLPGMNSLDYGALHSDVRLTTFLFSPALRRGFEAGRTRVEPLSYAQITDRLRTMGPDVAILHLTPAEGGMCSFGVSADFGPIVAASARYRIGVINTAMPRPVTSPTIPWRALDAVFEVHAPLPTGVSGSEPDRIGRLCADLIPDDATLQTGLGGAPDGVWSALGSHSGLRLWSGLATDGFLRAKAAGAMADGGHMAGVAFGSNALLQALDGAHDVAFADAGVTHSTERLAVLPRFHAVNSALEVDLFGQANLEWRDGRMVSGVGGAPEFMSAARRAPDGLAILALPATNRSGEISRIVARLASPTVSLSRNMIDVVVTEHGTARLTDLDMDARAERLIAIAEPGSRATLAQAWSELRHTL